MDLSKFGEYGLVGLMVAAIIGLLFIIIKWVLKEHHDLMNQQAEERKCWHTTIIQQNEALHKIRESIDEHDRRADERGKYVRSEHEKMINNLDEIGKTLARINGYKHD